MSLATLWRSMYSDMSRRIIFSSLSKSCAARALAVSVLPTPVGPRKMKEPIGRPSSARPARERRMASATAVIASSWPMTRWCSSSSRCRLLAPSRRRATGMRVAGPRLRPLPPPTLRRAYLASSNSAVSRTSPRAWVVLWSLWRFPGRTRVQRPRSACAPGRAALVGHVLLGWLSRLPSRPAPGRCGR